MLRHALWESRAVVTFAVSRSPPLMDVMDERTRRHQASPSRAGKAGRTRKSVSKDLLMNGQPYPRLRGCVWYHFRGRARPPPTCWFPLPCDCWPRRKKDVGASGCCTPTNKDSSFPRPMFTLSFFGSRAGRSSASTRYAPEVAQCCLVVFFS